MVFKNTYFELDHIYQPGRKLPTTVVEVETEETGDIQPPPGILIEKEVTGDKKYKNSTLAQRPNH